MADQDRINPTTNSETDISKAQSQQQPPNQASQGRETQGERDQFSADRRDPASERSDASQSPSGSPDAGMQGDTLTRRQSDIEGSSIEPDSRERDERGFVGSEGRRDSSSSELVEDQQFEKDGQGAPDQQ